MHDVAIYTEEELELLWQKLMCDIYYEFVYEQRDHQMWEAGVETLNKIGQD